MDHQEEDQILMARLNALEQSLTRVMELIKEIRESRKLPEKDRILDLDQDTGNTLWGAFGIIAKNRRDDLQDIQQKLKSGNADLKGMWEIYQDKAKINEQFFSECLEFLGGLALRDRSIDEGLCQLADDLLMRCETVVRMGWRSLTVPASDATLPISPSHIIRLQVLERSIWTLPLTAYQFACITLESKSESMKWFENYDERVKQQLKDLMAVSLATFLMGPAYVCSAITLDFNPQKAHIDDDEHLSDHKRAYVMLEILGRMNEEYEEVTRVLRDQWKTALRSLGQTKEGLDENKTQLDNWVETIWGEINDKFPLAVYPDSETDEGWVLAKRWRNEYKLIKTWGKVEVNKLHSLRDVLNAAWLCRINRDEDINKLEDEAKELYKRIAARGAESTEKKITPSIKQQLRRDEIRH